VLSDEDKRSVYDRYGHDGLKQHEQQKGGGHHNPFDMFSQFFGGGRAPQERRGPDMRLNMELELQEMYSGSYPEASLSVLAVLISKLTRGAQLLDRCS
jgi:DnaJ-related protein SCJ1